MSDQLRDLIRRHGGLVTTGDLARRWRVSRARASELAAHSTFPDPVARVGGGRTAIFTVEETDAWRSEIRTGGPPAAVGSVHSAESLAVELGIGAKTLRHWLRETYPDEAPGQGRQWAITASHVDAARDRWPA